MSAQPPPDKDRELRLLNNVEFRFATAKTDEALHELLNKYLCAVLLKLASPHAEVQQKVVTMCNHINTRIHNSPQPLPLEGLLEQFQNPESPTVLKNFDLVYIRKGISRISTEERLALLPRLLSGISEYENAQHQRAVFNLILSVLPDYKPPPRGAEEDRALRETLNINDAAARWLVRWFGKLMLLQTAAFTAEKVTPGLSTSDIEFFKDLDTLKGMSLSKLDALKTAVVRFLDTGAFTDEERLFPIFIAAEDGGQVSGNAETILKRTITPDHLEDEKTVDQLFALLLGANGTAPAKPLLGARILGLLRKSREASAPKRKDDIVKIIDLGLETDIKRLREAVLAFANWVCQISGDELMNALAPGVINKLRAWIMTKDTEPSTQGQAYELIALMAGRCIQLVTEPRLEIVRFLFLMLISERPVGQPHVETALNILLRPLSQTAISDEVRDALQTLLLRTIHENTVATIHAVKWAGRLFSFDNIIGKWIAVLGMGLGNNVAEEAAKALHPYHYRLNNPEPLGARKPDPESMDTDEDNKDRYAFPRYQDVIECFFLKDYLLPKAFEDQKPVGTRLPLKSFVAALSFAKRIAIWEGLGSEAAEIKLDEDWEYNIDAALDTDETARSHVQAFLSEQLKLRNREYGKSVVENFLDEAWCGLTYDGEGVETVRNVWNDMAVLVPSWALEKYIHDNGAKWLLSSFNAQTRHAAAFAVGLLGSHEKVAVQEFVLPLLNELESGGKPGHVLAIGFLLSRLKMRGRLDSCVPQENLVKNITAITTLLLSSKDVTLVDAALEALSELLVFQVFSAELVDTSEVNTKLQEKAVRGDDKSLLALAYLSFIQPEDWEKDDDPVLQKLFEIGEKGGVDRAFVVGDAIAAYAAGWGSSSVRRGRHLASAADWRGVRRGGVLKVLDILLSRAVEPGGLAKRRLAAVSLLSMFQRCTEDKSVRERLGQAQQVFRSLLTDKDEFVQETAARGLTAVYNLSDEATRKDLVRTLVSSFTGEKTEKITVNRDTQLFDPGAMPTGEGKSVGSYGDIMSLASELGDPSLVYKFMALARHNSVWASRAAFGRFGLGNILSTSEEVKNNKKLWPVLYRYRFDPNSGVRSSMESIWSALGGGVDTIERWWEEILAECLKGALNGREYRVREASVMALVDLLGSRQVTQYKDSLEDIWKIAFKVLDDVKGSVREAAVKLCKVLTNSMVRAIEGGAGPKDKADMLKTLMTFLMGQQGLEAGAKDVQMSALVTLLKLTKSAGENLRPWIPEVVDKLLLVMSDLEPEVVNYLIMNADKYKTTAEQVDTVRLDSIRHSPIMSAVEEVLDNLDEETTARLIPYLTKAIRTSLGLPTKVGCSRVVVSLVMRKPHLLKPHASAVLKSLIAALGDVSEAVCKSNAAAIGYLCRIMDEKGIMQAVDWTQKSYWEGEERERALAGSVIKAIYKHATDQANSMASAILPFAFIGKNDTAQSVAEEFSGTWTENTGGSMAVKLYLSEIVQLASANLSSPRWSAKQTSAFALAAAATAIAQDITGAQLETLWPAMVAAVGGKSWDGREKVLDAFVTLATKATHCTELGPTKQMELKKIVLREAKRNNKAYASQALRCLGTFAEGFPDIDMFDDVYDIVEAALGEADGDDMDIDSAGGKSSKQILQETLVNGLRAMACAFAPRPNRNQSVQQARKILDTLDTRVMGGEMPLKTCSVEAIATVVSKLEKQDGLVSAEEWAPVLDRVWMRIFSHTADKSFMAVRLKGAAVIGSFGKVLEQFHNIGPGGAAYTDLADKVRRDLQQLLETEPAPMVLQILRPAAQSTLGLLTNVEKS